MDMPRREQIQSLFYARFALDPSETDPLAEQALALLHSWNSYREPLSGPARRLNDLLFDFFYRRLGPSMTYRDGYGRPRRVTLSVLSDLTDDLMGLLFDTFRSSSASHFERLHAYWMETGSPAAMRCLVTRYADLLPPIEREMIARYLEENPRQS